MTPASNGQLSLSGPGEGRLNLYAAGLSGLCLIHCIALPLLASIAPLAAQLSGIELIHKVLVMLAIPVSGWAAWRALPGAGSWTFATAILIGLGLLFAAAFVEALSSQEQPITIAGALLLAAAHLWRWFRQGDIASSSGGTSRRNRPSPP